MVSSPVLDLVEYSKPRGFQQGRKTNNTGKGQLDLVSWRSSFLLLHNSSKTLRACEKNENFNIFLSCVQALKLLSETLKHNGLPQLPGITSSGDSAPGPGAADSSGGFLSGTFRALLKVLSSEMDPA